VAPPPAESGPSLGPPRAQATPSAPRRAAPAASAGRLRQETDLIREARQALRQGDARRALALLAECRRLFPRGVLEQERERLAIEALSRSGRGAEAAARAAAFLRKYPDSPHAGEIRGLGLGGPPGR
jgi:outer membrane protein assembly factor BamD (BamD/ComL family)